MTTSPAAVGPDVLFETRGSVAVVTLNRPQTLNSFTASMHQALWAALDAAEADTAVRAVVFTGSGKGFCAGADLSSFDFSPGPNLAQRANPGPTIEAHFNPTARRLMNLPMPTLAAVNGVAAGAGASFVMACDIAIAAPSASFVQAFAKIGLIPDAGGSWLLVERLGLARALALAMTGQKLPAAQARDFGLIWEVADDPLARAVELAGQLATLPTQALVATRSLLREAATRSFNQQLDAERDAQGHLGAQPDYIEGVTAFLQKRPPNFTGR